MTIEEIRKGAPYGSTHYMIFGKSACYLSKSHNDWIFHYKGEWFMYNGTFGYGGIKPLF